MNRRGFAQIHRMLLSTLLILGLALAVGCQSSPEAEEEMPPAQPIEEYDEPEDPYDEPPPESEPVPPADQQPPPADPMAPQGQAEPVDDEQLNNFADAVVQTQEVSERFEAQLQQAESQQEAMQIQEQAMIEIQREVEATGMPFQEFIMIAEQIERDPALQQRLEELLQERGVSLQ